jgi:alkanesulfonate monooxygenase SsuD/methylene tetrahydromethanopterin reductase-like flavin-dependent oxidoreductase (luciferase family)
MATGCFISTGRSLERAVDRVKLAEELGYEAVYITQIAGRDALTVITAYALATERIRVGTGVVPIYTRTPATMAQTAVTIDELSGGRLNLGLGVSHRPVVEGWYGQTIGKPVREMREYAAIVRAIVRGEDPPAGEKWRTGFRLSGVEPRPDLKLYVAALSPAMLRAAGEIADGVILWLCNPEYIERVVVPEVANGRERAGRSLEGFDIVAAVPSAATDDPQAAFDAMRSDLLPYFGLPYYRVMLERSGFEKEIRDFDAAAGDVDAMRAAISDRFLSALTAVGDVGAGIERYRAAGATSPCVGPIPGTDFEATLRAARPGG